MQFAKKAFSPYLTFETCSEWEDVHPNRVLAPRVKFPKNKGGSEVIFTFYKGIDGIYENLNLLSIHSSNDCTFLVSSVEFYQVPDPGI